MSTEITLLAQAIQSPIRMKTRGKYLKGFPCGAIVHHTSGNYKPESTQETINGGAKQGYAYLCIGIDGKIIQAHPINEWGYHAGESRWDGLGSGVSDKLIGIEICNAGKLTERKDGTLVSWFSKTIPKDQARYVTEDEWGCPTGWYHAFSPAQEKTLIEFLLWMKVQKPDVFNFDYVLAHHEVSGKKGIGYWRKNDCGGSLSMPMSEFRELLKTEYKNHK